MIAYVTDVPVELFITVVERLKLH